MKSRFSALPLMSANINKSALFNSLKGDDLMMNTRLTGERHCLIVEAVLATCPAAPLSSSESFRLCVQFISVDIDDAASLESALKGIDLVVHTAGPFQRKDTCGVLEAAIATRTPYMDVCDDTEHSQKLRAYSDQAKAAGVPAITTAGVPLGSEPQEA
jgi:saccharopine dehydrogenase-like NADP-dependent oxidoreductase